MRTIQSILYPTLNKSSGIKWQSETITQKNRIESDGGKVIDLIFMNKVISTLKQLGIYGNCKLLTDANFAVKKDGSGAVSKLYDISGNNNDIIQATGASQPIWSLVNGKGVITYDGVNDLLSTASNFGTNNGLSGNPSFTTIFKCKKTLSTKGCLFGWGDNSVSLNAFGLYDDGTSLAYSYSGNNYFISPIPINTDLQLSYSKIIGAINTKSISLRNGITDATTGHSTTTPNLNGIQPLQIGRWATLTSIYYQGQINSSTIFNIALTQSQITTLYNAGL